ncbi:MAG: glycosyltransferase family 2 protein [Acidobacteria bacterium]|nr:glycosyltransferase family 2 protein [Acidobacteriota bacterium]
MISVVVVNWNSGRLLQRCVQSLRDHARQCRVLVVDNASTDTSLELALEAHPGLTVLTSGYNTGFAAACNRGWRAAQGETILFLNPDTECFPGSVDCMERTLSGDRTVWAVGGCLVGADGKPQADFNVRRFPSMGSAAAEMFFVDGLRRAWRRNRPAGRAVPGNAADVEQPAAACLMVKRTALLSTGGFDEAFYPAWFEDVDLCLRIHKSGGRIRFQPRARFFHHGGYSLRQMDRRDFLTYFHRNQIRYFNKHRGFQAALWVRRLVLAGLFLRAAVSLAYPLLEETSRGKSARVFWDAFKNIAKSREVSA